MIGILLLTFGSATTAQDVPAYLASVRSGREVPAELITEFRRRYDRIGRSPLIDITLNQARLLREALTLEHGEGEFGVAVGMLHSAPRVGDAVDDLLKAGAHRLLAIVLAPQYSPIILSGYERALDSVRAAHPDVVVEVAGAWHDLPAWIDSLAARVSQALQTLPEATRDSVPIIFTAHSLPRAVVDRDPGYIDQLRQTAEDLASALRLATSRWMFAYQSAGHTAEPWLTPDVKDLLPSLAASGHRDVLVVPLQFVSDHLETLYDIDVVAAQEAAAAGIGLHRIEMPNTSPSFVAALTAVVAREMNIIEMAG